MLGKPGGRTPAGVHASCLYIDWPVQDDPGRVPQGRDLGVQMPFPERCSLQAFWVGFRTYSVLALKEVAGCFKTLSRLHLPLSTR